ncbi:Fic family protein [Mucilaginibacter psychrotolerans]|uniref:Fic family protein n=2 Tax=Mucilaginibacter psychrotolerans TaxID=1524096 RepID=A0A4Y8SRN4_9SPHI|nr:Fic family protein [Mucilaginibacter psychrotolerans]
MDLRLNILPVDMLQSYCGSFDSDVELAFLQLIESELSADTFSFYTSVSAVFSSKIEGEQIDLDSFVKHKISGAKFLPDYTQKIDDLYDAYLFAQSNNLNAEALRQAHVLLTRHILQKEQRGKVRMDNMFVVTTDGKIEYVACLPPHVESELAKLYDDIAILLDAELSVAETFYFASLIHLVFVKVHPFYDGNGRSARLLEKWFLAEKLGKKAWFLQSEKHYYNFHDTCYKNIRFLGLEYEVLDYSKAMAFLKMLPQGLFA